MKGPFLLAFSALALAGGILSCGTEPAFQTTPVELYVEGFPGFLIPEDNPLTEEGIRLGRRLFYDPILSADSTLACSGCHRPEAAFADRGAPVSLGVGDVPGTRNTPTLVNPLWHRGLFWDGRALDLEDQALAPVPSEKEMNLPWEQAEQRLRGHSTYPGLFRDAFGPIPITRDLVVKALAQFQRTLISQNSRFDRWNRGELELTAAEDRGRVLFFTEKGDCFHCHGDPLFTDLGFRNNGLDSVLTDLGLGLTTGDTLDYGKFRTPTLRNLVFSPPYMHDGRFETIEDVIRHYNQGGHFTPTVDPLIRVGAGLGLSEQDIADIAAFLRALTDSGFVENPDYLSPF